MNEISGLAGARAAIEAHRQEIEAEERLLDVVDGLVVAARDAGWIAVATVVPAEPQTFRRIGEVLVALRRGGDDRAPVTPAAPVAFAETAAPVETTCDVGADAPLTMRSGPWTDAEVARLKEMRSAGADARQISDELRRDVRSVTGRMAALAIAERRAAKAEAEKSELTAAPPDAPAAAEPVALVRKPDGPPNLGIPAWKRDLTAHLDQLGYVDPWTPVKDLTLVNCLFRGDGIAGAVEALGIERMHCILRWQSLNTLPGDLDHQRNLLEVLRERAA